MHRQLSITSIAPGSLLPRVGLASANTKEAWSGGVDIPPPHPTRSLTAEPPEPRAFSQRPIPCNSKPKHHHDDCEENDVSSMASDPDRDKDANPSSPPKSENPFIRFRQFADEQISSLLRGVIGLPSTFERGQNAKWASFDEDLRRRDELQARQQQLRESEVQRAFGRLSAEDADFGNKPFPKRNGNLGAIPNGDTFSQMDEKTARDLPLFSSVHKSLFDHLEKRGDNAPDWNAASCINSVKEGLIPSYWPNPLLQKQQSGDFMRNMQYVKICPSHKILGAEDSGVFGSSAPE